VVAGKRAVSVGSKSTSAKPQTTSTKQPKRVAELVEIRVTLEDVKPAVMRELVVSTSHSLDELHDIIQTAMGWQNCHMHAFQIPGTRESFGDTSMFDGGEDMEDEEDVSIGDLVARGVKKIRYTYDFGDDWHHTITFGKAVEPKPGVMYPLCTGGKGACPPEDSGGPWGYADKIAILADPKHEDYEETREWMGPFVLPERFSIEEVNALLHPKKKASTQRPSETASRKSK
jgi:Plasmid pRiA4b ORF-3-like protein